MDLFLEMGQSNMLWRGVSEPVAGPLEDSCAPVVLLDSEDRWAVAANVEESIHCERGIGPGYFFGEAMAEACPDIRIGRIPCAVGGTPLERWEKGGDLYDRAMERTKLAMRRGDLKAVLWVQGENDCVGDQPEWARTYEERLSRMIAAIRGDLAMADIPFICAEIGRFLAINEQFPFADQINAALNSIAQSISNVTVISSEGLEDRGDHLHYSPDAYGVLGKRFAEAYLQLGNE